MPHKAAKKNVPVEESKRLERRGRELVEQVKALASEVAEAKAKSEDRRAKQKG